MSLSLFDILLIVIFFLHLLLFKLCSAQNNVSGTSKIDHISNNLAILKILNDTDFTDINETDNLEKLGYDILKHDKPAEFTEKSNLKINKISKETNLKQIGDHILNVALKLKPLISQPNLGSNATFILELIGKVDSIFNSLDVVNFELLPRDIQSKIEHLKESLENIKTSLFLAANREEINVVEKLSPSSNRRKKLALIRKLIMILKKETSSFPKNKSLKRDEFSLFVNKFKLNYILALVNKIGVEHMPKEIKEATMELQQIIHNFMQKNKKNEHKTVGKVPQNDVNISSLVLQRDFQFIHSFLDNITHALKGINFSKFHQYDVIQFEDNHKTFNTILVELFKLGTNQLPHTLFLKVNKLNHYFNVLNTLMQNGNIDFNIYKEAILRLDEKHKEIDQLNYTVRIPYYNILLNELSEICTELEELKEYNLATIIEDKVEDLLDIFMQFKTEVLRELEDFKLTTSKSIPFVQVNNHVNSTLELLSVVEIKLENLKIQAKDETDDAVLSQLRMEAKEMDLTLRRLKNESISTALTEKIIFLQLNVENFENEISLLVLMSLVNKYNGMHNESGKISIRTSIARQVSDILHNFEDTFETLKNKFMTVEDPSKLTDMHIQLDELSEKVNIIVKTTHEFEQIPNSVFNKLLTLKKGIQVFIKQVKSNGLELNKKRDNAKSISNEGSELDSNISKNESRALISNVDYKCDISMLENELIDVMVIDSECDYNYSSKSHLILHLLNNLNNSKQKCSKGTNKFKIEELEVLAKKTASKLDNTKLGQVNTTLNSSKIDLDRFKAVSTILFHLKEIKTVINHLFFSERSTDNLPNFEQSPSQKTRIVMEHRNAFSSLETFLSHFQSLIDELISLIPEEKQKFTNLKIKEDFIKYGIHFDIYLKKYP